MAANNDKTDFYLYLSSNDNKLIFTENRSSNFHCIIPDGINFEGKKWECAVINVGYYPNASLPLTDSPKPVYLLSNFVKPSYTPVANAPIMRQFYISDNLWKTISKNIIIPEYHEVSVTSLSLVNLYITDSSFQIAHLPDGLFAVTLHFRTKE